MDVAHNHPLISYNDALNKMKEYIVSMYSKKGKKLLMQILKQSIWEPKAWERLTSILLGLI